MTQYVAMLWDGDTDPSPRVGWLRRTLGDEPDWRIALDQPGLLVAMSALHPLRLRHVVGGGLIVGDLFSLAGEDAGDAIRPDSAEPRSLFARLSTEYWGRYVAIVSARDGASVFRDPMGGLECVTFDAAGVQVVASAVPPWLLTGLSPRLAIDWDCVALQLRHPTNISARVALTGMMAVTPGDMLGPGGKHEVIWRPGMIARRGVKKGDPLPAVVDMCVDALARRRKVLAEVSGGIDSAITATALARAKDAPVGQWLNYHLDDAEGDERNFARLVAGATGGTLIEPKKPEFQFDENGLAERSQGPRPAIWASDLNYDRDIARRCSELGADALFTGKGGDSVFFQMASPLIAADHVRARGLRGLSDGVLSDLARWKKTSIWSMLGAALFAPGGPRATAGHPWLQEIEDLPPGKRLHLRSLTSCLTYSGECRRSEAAHLIHPLLSQPVVEHCLALSSVELTEGRRDRTYARRAFASRLPPEVVWRWGKGDATAYVGKAIAEQRTFLRSYLLEGSLAHRGLLNRRRIEDTLQEESLIWRGGAGMIVHTVMVEAWARAWQRRLRTLD